MKKSLINVLLDIIFIISSFSACRNAQHNVSATQFFIFLYTYMFVFDLCTLSPLSSLSKIYDTATKNPFFG